MLVKTFFVDCALTGQEIRQPIVWPAYDLPKNVVVVDAIWVPERKYYNDMMPKHFKNPGESILLLRNINQNDLIKAYQKIA